MGIRGKRGISVAMAFAVALSAIGLGGGSRESQAAPQEVSPTLSPPSNQTAVKNGNLVRFGGSAPADSTPAGAVLRFFDAAGERVPLNKSHADEDLDVSQRVKIQGGVIEGDMTIPSLPLELDDGAVVLIVTVELDDGESLLSGESDPLSIDLTPPRIVGTLLSKTNEIEVRFSEAVQPGGILSGSPLEESPTDWRLCPSATCDPDGDLIAEGIFFPLSVEGSGDTRILTLSSVHAQDEDATPSVRYRPAPRDAYVDRAGWVLGAAGRLTVAADRIPPVKPVIDRINGEATKVLVTNEPKPTVRLAGLREGHVGQLWLESNDEAGFQANDDTLLAEAVAEGDGVAEVELAEELQDGEHTLYGVARDNAKCNPSQPDSAVCPNHSDADTASYTLDTIAPKALLAQITEDPSGNEIRVEFTEAVTPDDGAGQWAVSTGGAVQSVTGTGHVRMLRTAAPVDHLTTVSWAPNGETYKDAAGNELEAFTLDATGGLPPIVTVTFPTNKVWTPDMAFPVQGTTNGSWTTHVQIFRNEDGEWIPITEISASDGSFRRVLALLPDEENRFRLQGLRKDESGVIQRVGQLVTVEPIVQDSTPPVVTVEPVGRALPSGEVGLQGEESTTIRWTASDTNLGAGPITVESSKDGGKTWKTEAASHSNTGQFGWQAPANTNTEAAMIRVSARDLAQHKTSAVSNAFVIDSEPPAFDATTIGATNVEVRFREPVVPNEVPDELEWTIKTESSDPIAIPVAKADPVMSPEIPGMLVGFDLTTGLVTGGPGALQQKIGPNEYPEVEYVPPADDDVLEQLKDRVGLTIDKKLVEAADGIPPLPPTLDGTHRTLVRTSPEQARGSAEHGLDSRGGSNIVIGRRTHPTARTYSQAVNEDGTFAVGLGLAKNKVNRFFLRVQDPSGNLSEPVEGIRIERDTKKPKVKILKPRQRMRKGQVRYRIRWRSVERNKGTVAVYVRFKSKNKKLRQWRRVAARAPDKGVHVWTVPKRFRGNRVRAMVRVRDAVGNRAPDRRHTRWYRIRR